MLPSPTFKIESFVPNKVQLEAYALAFKEAVTNWQNYLGDPIYMSKEEFEEDAEKLRKDISKAGLSKCIALLKKYDAIPEKLFRITELSSGASDSLPIYTGIRQISLEGQGSILAEAFLGAEIHLLNAAGKLVSIYDREYSPLLGLGQLYLIDCNDLYDSQVKGRRPDPQAMEIVGYAPENITRSFTFHSQLGREYEIGNKFEPEQRITGTGNDITVSNLKYLGQYYLSAKSDANDEWEFGDFPGSCVVNYSHYVGLEWKNIRDFTIQYNTFPFLNKRDYWVLEADFLSANERCKIFTERSLDREFIEKQLKEDPCSFQFMPMEIRGNREWVETFCLKEPVNFLFVEPSMRNDRELAIQLIRSADKYEDSVYPYLPQFLRKDLDILIIMKEVGRLFHLPDPEEVGEAKFKDIREFVSNNKSRIYDVLAIFPNALRYAPAEVLKDRQLILSALPADNYLVKYLSEALRDDPDIIMAASGKYFASLEFASQRLREDPVFVKQMINKNGENICFSAEWMRAEREFVLAASPAGTRIFKFLPEYFRDDEEIILTMLKDNGYALEKASERLRLDKNFNLKALDHGAYYRHNIHESLLDDRDIVLKAMQMHPHQFESIPERFKSDREIVLAVVSRKGGYGKYIKDCPHELRDDPELIKAAVKDNEFNIKYASPRLLADRYFLAEIIYDNPSSLSKIPDNMQRDPGLCELARRRREELDKNKPLKSESSNLEDDDLPF